MTTSVVRKIYRKFPRIMTALLLLAVFSSPFSAYGGVKDTTRKLPFQPGEKLTYQVSWRGIPAGEAVIEVLPMETVGRTKAYHFAMRTETNAMVDLVYKVREQQDSYVDAGMTNSILYKKKSKGRHPRDVVITFDWKKLRATYSNFGESMAPIGLVRGSFDPLALFFAIRLQDISRTRVFELPVTDGKKSILVKAVIVKRERIALTGKDYDTLMVVPDMERLEGVVSRSDNPQLTVWLTADDRKIPVRLRSRVAVGYFVFDLVALQP
jgi:hypothetical protein